MTTPRDHRDEGGGWAFSPVLARTCHFARSDRKATDKLWSFALHTIFWGRIYNQILNFLFWVGWMASEPQGSTCSHNPPPALGYRHPLPLPAFYMSSGDQIQVFKLLWQTYYPLSHLSTQANRFLKIIFDVIYSFGGKLIFHFSVDLQHSDNNGLFLTYLSNICMSC